MSCWGTQAYPQQESQYPQDSVRQADGCVCQIKVAAQDGAGRVVLREEAGRDGHPGGGGPQLPPPRTLPTWPLEVMLITH